jgi:putative lipoprotein
MNPSPSTPPASPLVLVLEAPPGADPIGQAVVHVVVEDVGEADAPAPTLLRRDFVGIPIDGVDASTHLELSLPNLSGAITPAVRIHVDRSGSGAIEPGDLINTARVEIPLAGERRCVVQLVEVR